MARQRKPLYREMDGIRVDVYKNLHLSAGRGPVYSVRDVGSGRVVAHSGCVVLRDAEFRVSEAGRQRVLRERRKNVHAVVRGTLHTGPAPSDDLMASASYNPYTAGYFFDRATGGELAAAEWAVLGNAGLWYIESRKDTGTGEGGHEDA